VRLAGQCARAEESAGSDGCRGVLRAHPPWRPTPARTAGPLGNTSACRRGGSFQRARPLALGVVPRQLEQMQGGTKPSLVTYDPLSEDGEVPGRPGRQDWGAEQSVSAQWDPGRHRVRLVAEVCDVT